MKRQATRGNRGAVAHGDAGERLDRMRSAVERRLDELSTPRGDDTDPLYAAVRHSLLAPGKRVRPALTLATAAVFAGSERAALDPACAVEMVHTASLIVDDMPSMDDAHLRRGRPANHRVFGEHVATLAAFELLAGAFGTIARAEGLGGELRSRLSDCLATAMGSHGLVGGQLLDLRSRCQRPDAGELRAMYGRKTGALIGASVELGARVAGVEEPGALLRLHDFATGFGIAFQILDDLKDRFGSAEAIGKDVRQDAAKTTFLSYADAREAREEVRRSIDSATQALAPLGEPGRQLAELGRALLEEAGAPRSSHDPG